MITLKDRSSVHLLDMDIDLRNPRRALTLIEHAIDDLREVFASPFSVSEVKRIESLRLSVQRIHLELDGIALTVADLKDTGALEPTKRPASPIAQVVLHDTDNDRPEDCGCGDYRKAIEDAHVAYSQLVAAADHPKANPEPSERELSNAWEI